jgi:hypothetical protein
LEVPEKPVISDKNMKAKFVGIPVAIIAAFAVVWLLIRKQGNAPVQQNAPNPSSSGVPQYTPASQAYNVAPYQSAPSPGLVLLAPSNPYDMGPGNDSYLKYNLGSGLDAAKSPGDIKKKCKDDCCGGCGSCTDNCNANNANWPDGRGGCMASNRRRQIGALTDTNPDQWQNWLNTLQSSNLGVDPTFDVGLAQQFATQNESPHGGDTSAPAAPRYAGLTYTGNAYVA